MNRKMLEPVWTRGGVYFGYFEGEDLWTRDGRHVGKIIGNEIYGETGHYLGEISGEHRLVTDVSKKSWCVDSFLPWPQHSGAEPHGNQVPFEVQAGYEDFPAPDRVR